MTTSAGDLDPFSPEADRIINQAEMSTARLREFIAHVDRSRNTQPQRLAAARKEAEQARDWAGIEEPWDNHWSAIPGFSRDGDLAGMLALPNITAKEMYGARLAFDMLDAGQDGDRLNDTMSRYFSMAHGDTAMMFLIAMSALSTIAETVVPMMLDDLETSASNYDARVLLAEARTKAWTSRAGTLRAEEHANRGSDAGDTDFGEPW